MLHLVKLSVGTESIEQQNAWVERRVAYNRERGLGAVHDHVTRMHPRRADALVDGGSVYWVIKGLILCRQEIIGIKRVTGADGIERSMILMQPTVVPTEPSPRKAFQGWRYLPPDDAPADIRPGRKAGGLPPHLHRELAELGLL